MPRDCKSSFCGLGLSLWDLSRRESHLEACEHCFLLTPQQHSFSQNKHVQVVFSNVLSSLDVQGCEIDASCTRDELRYYLRRGVEAGLSRFPLTSANVVVWIQP